MTRRPGPTSTIHDRFEESSRAECHPANESVSWRPRNVSQRDYPMRVRSAFASLSSLRILRQNFLFSIYLCCCCCWCSLALRITRHFVRRMMRPRHLFHTWTRAPSSSSRVGTDSLAPERTVSTKLIGNIFVTNYVRWEF